MAEIYNFNTFIYIKQGMNQSNHACIKINQINANLVAYIFERISRRVIYEIVFTVATWLHGFLFADSSAFGILILDKVALAIFAIHFYIHALD